MNFSFVLFVAILALLANLTIALPSPRSDAVIRPPPRDNPRTTKTPSPSPSPSPTPTPKTLPCGGRVPNRFCCGGIRVCGCNGSRIRCDKK
ncbi:hypothetical protein C1645_815868 [Glomus cerebriforme]|uniref:Uncharacterized protein n=1 Tax=Glomus cerebriforme TaxID=658196 RepID=A0A397TFD2_9GLOM|nr:hypothetical protein C1645_815868 [Glomus cerebriforme]